MKNFKGLAHKSKHIKISATVWVEPFPTRFGTTSWLTKDRRQTDEITGLPDIMGQHDFMKDAVAFAGTLPKPVCSLCNSEILELVVDCISGELFCSEQCEDTSAMVLRADCEQ